jgi:Uma2 family endonuclease
MSHEVNREIRAADGGSLEVMPTLVLDPPPADFEALLERRRQFGQDLLDEVWEGVYHMNPAPHQRHAHVAQQLAELLGAPARDAGLVPMISIFNLGEPDDYRVPDGGLFRPGPDEVYVPTAELVVEIVSPGDESWQKLGFYAAHDVGELLIVDPQEHQVQWLGLQPGGEYQQVERSGLIALGPAELAEQIDWPD